MPGTPVWPSDLPRPPEPDECGDLLHDCEVGGDTNIIVDTKARAMPMHAGQPSNLPRPPEPDECRVVPHAGEVDRDASITQ